MMVTQPILAKSSCTGGRAEEMASQPPQPSMTKGVAMARPTKMMMNWTRSEIWSAIMPPKVV